MYQFTPPIAYQQPYSERSPLWCRVTLAVPYTVAKTTTGAYHQELEHNPDRADIAIVYEGGHVFTVDNDEAADLIAAGYTVTPVYVDLGNGYTDAPFSAVDTEDGYSTADISALDLLNGYLNL